MNFINTVCKKVIICMIIAFFVCCLSSFTSYSESENATQKTGIIISTDTILFNDNTSYTYTTATPFPQSAINQSVIADFDTSGAVIKVTIISHKEEEEEEGGHYYA